MESRFTKDELLDTVMIYWVTESYGTSARYYYEGAHDPWRPFHNRVPVVKAPVAATIFPQEVIQQPKRWAERYYNCNVGRQCRRVDILGQWRKLKH